MRKSPLYAFFWGLVLTFGGLALVVFVIACGLFVMARGNPFGQDLAGILLAITLPFLFIALLVLARPPEKEAFDEGGIAGVTLAVLVTPCILGSLLVIYSWLSLLWMS